jgi:hypothetical protein
MPEEVAQRSRFRKKKRQRGLKPKVIQATYAALKGRSSTVAQTFVAFSASCEGIP